MSKEIECPLESLECALATYPEDMSLDHRMAWIYGIALGWTDEALKDIAERYR